MSIQIRPDAPRFGRELDEILEFHKLAAGYFAGKTILDLGCGDSDIGQKLHDRCISAKVIGIDADFANEDTFQSTSHTIRRLGNIGLPLDIADNSIDIVLATFSLPMWGKTDEEVRTFFHEIKRILRPGGLLSIYPMLVASPIAKSQGPSAHELTCMRRTVASQPRKLRWSYRWRLHAADELLQATKR